MLIGVNMTIKQQWRVICALLFLSLLHGGATHAQQASAGTGSDLGYPTVAAALQALVAKPGVLVSVQRDWTIVEDPAERAVWSFAPAGHAAYPAVVKRSTVERDGSVSLDMRALCQAAKPACDALMAQFEQMNAHIAGTMAGRSEQSHGAWTPGAQLQHDAVALLTRFHGAIDTQRYRDAYAMFTPGTQLMLSFDQFAASEVGLRAEAGGAITRVIGKTTWYKDPPNAVGPGAFATFDETCTADKLASCVEVIILHQPPEGALQVLRYERTMRQK